MVFHHFFPTLSIIVFYFTVLTERIILCQTITTRNIINAELILITFCQLDEKLSVMECVDHETQGQALIPWTSCLNPDRDLTKKELINICCKTLHPTYRMVLEDLTGCVDNLMSPVDAAVWMPIMEGCALSISETSHADSTLIIPRRETTGYTDYITS